MQTALVQQGALVVLGLHQAPCAVHLQLRVAREVHLPLVWLVVVVVVHHMELAALAELRLGLVEAQGEEAGVVMEEQLPQALVAAGVDCLMAVHRTPPLQIQMVEEAGLLGRGEALPTLQMVGVAVQGHLLVVVEAFLLLHPHYFPQKMVLGKVRS